jgi:hypothetical protein
MFIGIDHTAITSPNPLQLAYSYADHLEPQIVSESQGKYFISAPNGTLLEIIPGNNEASVPGMTAIGVRHIALRVHNIEAAQQQLVTSSSLPTSYTFKTLTCAPSSFGTRRGTFSI